MTYWFLNFPWFHSHFLKYKYSPNLFAFSFSIFQPTSISVFTESWSGGPPLALYRCPPEVSVFLKLRSPELDTAVLFVRTTSNSTPLFTGFSTTCIRMLSLTHCRNLLDRVCLAVLLYQQTSGWLKSPRGEPVPVITRLLSSCGTACNHVVFYNWGQTYRLAVVFSQHTLRIVCPLCKQQVPIWSNIYLSTAQILSF